MKMIKRFYLVYVLAVVLFSCSSSNENDPALLAIRFEGTSSSVNNGRVSSGLEITEALIGVTKIEFEMEHEGDHHDSSEDSGSRTSHDDDDDEDDENEFEIKGNWVVDLLDGTSNPELPTLSVDPGQFNEIKIVMSPIIDGQYSVILKAEYTDGGNIIPIDLLLSNEIIFKVEHSSVFEVNAEKLNEIIIQMELDKWLSKIDFSSLDHENGEIKISVDHNNGEIEKIKINIKNSCGTKSNDSDDD